MLKPDYTYLILLMLTLVLFSCREGIVHPENFATNVNEPVQSNERNSYTFILNAENLTIDVTNNTRISSLTSRITITLVDHSSGYIRVSVNDIESVRRFSYFGDEEQKITESLIGYIPDQVSINAVGFSGKIQVHLNRTF